MTGSLETRKQAVILIVDDTASVRCMGRDALEEAGLAVLEARDGEEALAVFRERRPDVVLLDVQMPGADGFAVCEEIRRERFGTDTPVVMMTACDDADSIQRAYEVGATDFVTKPVQWTVLCERIRYMLRMSRALAALRAHRERLARAQRIARLADWELDLRSGTIACSEELRALYGLPAGGQQVPYAAILELVHPEDRDVLRGAAERALRDRVVLSVDHRLPTSDAGEKMIHLEADLVHDEEGRPVRLSGTAQDVTERRWAEQEIRFLAYHDALTKLGNRRLFAERLEFALGRAQRQGGLVAVLFLDLDHFKRINDTLGHAAGDHLLQVVAERLRRCTRATDIVSRALQEPAGPLISRFGGDEFMVSVCSVESREEAAKVAERILQEVAQPVEVGGQTLVVTASLGIALWPSDGEDVETLIRNADAAMYHAKGQGRGVHRFYEASMNSIAERNLRLESDLRGAIDRSELLVHYQPKLEIATRRITGFEALVRWRHPTLGMVPPDVFVPVCEQAGLIGALGEFVLRQACAQAKAWRQAGLPPVRIAVNLSAHQFRNSEVGERIVRAVRETPISPRQLEVEITESAMMENQAITVGVLRMLKGVGVTVSLDDFGTGYSSLGYLKGFPVDCVKIDRTFVRDLSSDPDDAALTAAIISMAKALSLKVVAEGVETEEQLEFLRRHGCDEAQGFLFSRPLPAEEATEFLRARMGAEVRSASDAADGGDA